MSQTGWPEAESALLGSLGKPPEAGRRTKGEITLTTARRVATAALLAAAAASAALAQDRPQVRVGVAAEPYPPFASQDASGQWAGWEIDLMGALCAQAKLDCVVTPVAWDGIIPALTSGKIDMIMASMSITPERAQTIDFSDKYYNVPAAMMGPKDSTWEATAEGLAGLVIGVQSGTTHVPYATKHFPQSELREYATQDEANQDLVAGRVDAVEIDSIAADPFLATDPGACCEVKAILPVDLEIMGPGIGAGFRKGDPLREAINAAIAAVRADGTYAEITSRYFDSDIYGD